MAIVKRPPNTVYLGGGDGPGGESGMTVINDYVAGVAITPGMLIEMYDDGGTNKWRPHASATEIVSPIVALEQIELNKGVDVVYAIGDLVKAGALRPGCFFWGLIPSGQDIANSEHLQSNGDGKLKAATATTAAANVARFKSQDNVGAVTADTRLRVEVLY